MKEKKKEGRKGERVRKNKEKINRKILYMHFDPEEK